MPISRVEVNEYQCARCGYRWINRVNGRDGPIPKKCARCKRNNWNRSVITPKEHGLRRRIRGFRGLYRTIGLNCSELSIAYCWSHELTEEFLRLNPRPTLAELERVIWPPGLVIDYLTSQNEAMRYSSKAGYVPDPDNQELLKFDKAEYIKIVKQEAQKRQDIIREIIKIRQG